ncbi:MAG: hypothetical protein J6M24_03335 [Lachnospiraceae bacterium]|nr:hypothetical protein [Lachnospiraceae bacterium]
MIICKYIDKLAAAEAVLRDYNSMLFILENTDDYIKNKIDEMYAVQTPGIDGMPKAHNPKAFENRMVECIDDVQLMKERYCQAREYMHWFMPAWTKLSSDERHVLDICYMREGKYNVTDNLVDELHLSKSQSYKYRNRALKHISLMLFGA